MARMQHGACGRQSFSFPELMAESSVATQHEFAMDNYDGSWEALLCAKAATNASRERSCSIPTYLKEERYKFTRLTPKHYFTVCPW